MTRRNLYPHAVWCGARIRSIRKQQGMTLKELAERTGLSFQYLSDVERGVVNTPIETLVKVSKGLDITLAILFQKADESGDADPSLAELTEAYHQLAVQYHRMIQGKVPQKGLEYDVSFALALA